MPDITIYFETDQDGTGFISTGRLREDVRLPEGAVEITQAVFEAKEKALYAEEEKVSAEGARIWNEETKPQRDALKKEARAALIAGEPLTEEQATVLTL